jgi:fatty acid synthase
MRVRISRWSGCRIGGGTAAATDPNVRTGIRHRIFDPRDLDYPGPFHREKVDAVTIDDSAVPGLRNINGDNDHGSAVPLIERISAGEPYALAFGGQGAPRLDAFTEVCDDHASTDEMAVLVARAASALAPVAAHLLVARPPGFDPLGWSRSGPAGEAGGRPGEAVLRSTAVSVSVCC